MANCFLPNPVYGAVLLALASLTLIGSEAAHAQSEALPHLKASTKLQETLPESVGRDVPNFISGERLSGKTDGMVTIEGGAELRRHDLVIKADRLEYDQQSNEAKASGNVLINRAGNRFEGPELQLNVQSSRGYFVQPRFSLLESEGQGEASRVDFLDENRLQAHSVRYSSCPRPVEGAWKPDWELRADRIELDNAKAVGVAHGGVLAFQGMPLLGLPYLSFPLSDQRKSGMLPPTINLDNVSGLELTLPYYLNLAPTFDATLYPTLMSKRGVDLGGELRYLQPTFGGQLRAAYMPNDQLRSTDRWGYSLQHGHNVSTDGLLASMGLHSSLGLRLNLNRVSDDNYWRDFARSSTSLTSRLLANEAVVNWNQGPWDFSAGAYRWQTLQDTSAPIVPPYDRLPTVALRFAKEHQTWGGLRDWSWSLLTEHTRFQSVPALTRQANGTRGLVVARLGHRWDAPGWFIAPNLQLHHASYRFDAPLVDGSRSTSRSLPTFSLDSGLVFEREAAVFGRAFVQTLEPRAFFTWTPTRDQSSLPNYDSAANDFNFATVYTENTFGGHDRIADLRALTVGVTSRLLDPGSGAEVVRLGLAQRLLLRDQTVILPGQSCASSGAAGCSPVINRLSDVLLGARVQWSPRWSTDANIQYSTDERESVRTTISGRYTPGDYRVLSAAYRLQRGTSEQLDIGWQWPLSDLWSRTPPGRQTGRALGPQQWYGVGRVNYSMPDRKIVDLVAGFEYDAGCWIGRVVFERLTTGLTTATQRVLLQVEFSGFSRIGSNPLQTLKTNVPRYQYLREDINPPNRFQQYD